MRNRYVPPNLMESRIFSQLINSEFTEADTFNQKAENLFQQAFIDTATWGLKYWEQFVGIEVDETLPLSYRRSRIKAKIRGQGQVTVSLFNTVGTAFENGEVDIIENMKNLIPPFDNGRWTLHSNSQVMEENDYLQLNATGNYQSSTLEAHVIDNRQYTVGGYTYQADGYISLHFLDREGNETGSRVYLGQGLTGYDETTFTTPDNTVKIKVYVSNSNTGVFDFKRLILMEGASIEPYRKWKEYSFTVRFISEQGTPPNLEDLKEAIKEIKPAHLAVEFEFRYLRIGEVHNIMTIAELENQVLDLFAGGVNSGKLYW